MPTLQSTSAVRAQSLSAFDDGSTHHVRHGETLSGIAAAHGVSVQDLMQANPHIRDADLIYAGDTLRIPPASHGHGGGAQPATHLIRPGETLSQLARTFNTDIATLARLNGIRNPNLIYAGQTLRLPGGSGRGSTGGTSPTSDTTTQPGHPTGNWMAIARGEMGQAEIAGSRNNPRIVQYHQTTTLHAKNDETPWCSSFVNWTLEKAGFKGTDSAAAISWAHWGQKVNGLSQGREGDVVVIRNRASGQEHVGFLVRTNGNQFTLLGGNQSNRVKESTFSTGSYEVVAVRRPPAAPATSPLPPTGGGKGITEADYQRVAHDLGVDVAAIKAVADVEASGSGMLPSGKPKILFEAHIFHRETGGRFDRSNPNLSSPSWNRSLYGAGGEHQWERFEAAYKLDPEAAIKATSWGRFQVMGFNHQRVGYATPQAFMAAMKSGEGKQLEAFAAFIRTDAKLLAALRNHDWASFAYRYNGAGYAQNHYDSKMAAAYAKFAH
jgi:uncharacterized protein (TIGR02594 family)